MGIIKFFYLSWGYHQPIMSLKLLVLMRTGPGSPSRLTLRGCWAPHRWLQPCSHTGTAEPSDLRKKDPTLLEALPLDMQTFPFTCTCTCFHIQLLLSHCLQQARLAERRIWPENSQFKGKQQLSNYQNPDFFKGEEKQNNKQLHFSFERNNFDAETIKELKMAPNSPCTALKFSLRVKLNKSNVYGLSKTLLLQLMSTS